MVAYIIFNLIALELLHCSGSVLIMRFAVIMQGTTRYKSPECDIFRNKSRIFFI